MATTATFFNLPSLECKSLFLVELIGQIADGQWENATPQNHWQFWCFAPDEVGIDAANLGVKSKYRYSKQGDFRTLRRNGYGFTRREFLDAVGDRMISIVKLYREYHKLFGDACFDMHLPDEASLFDFYVKQSREEMEKGKEGYYTKTVKEWEKNGLTSEKLHSIEDADPYDLKALKIDLRAISKAMKLISK